MHTLDAVMEPLDETNNGTATGTGTATPTPSATGTGTPAASSSGAAASPVEALRYWTIWGLLAGSLVF